MDITNLSLNQTIKAINSKQFSYRELNEAYLKKINLLNPKLNAFLEINGNSAKIPSALKDIISTKDMATTAGSKILEGYKPPYNATVVNRLLVKNVSVLGKTNCDEFAMGSSGENSAYGPTLNPWNFKKVPGGSSSGSAAAIAANMCVFALGSDTGGSVRQPASLCGVVGFKPSYGRISRYGFVAMASSLDCPGTFTKTVEDSKLLLKWLEGEDGYDANALKTKISSQPPLKSLRGLKIGVPKEYFGQGLNLQVERVIGQAITKLVSLGAEVVDIKLPHTDYAVACYYIIMSSEVSSNLARFDGIRFGWDRSKFGPEVKRRIMLGTFSLSSGYFDEYFKKAAKVRSLIKEDFVKAFEKCDVILGPVSPTVAWNLGEKISDPLAMYLSDVYTIPASLAGIPGLSLPCGLVEGLPVGLQILGPYLKDELVLSVGQIYEQNRDWTGLSI